jgi:2'-phosphotransferase
MSVSNGDSSSKPAGLRKHRPGKGKERETFGGASSNQPKRNQSHKPGSKLRGQDRDSREVRISKTLSWLLRHGAQSEGLKIRKDGYVKVDDLVRSISPC